ncbi:MAG: GNAT family N-acetyltransferase [Pseudoflavonifractor sp.]|nr:GNAT family N-acetyltransferase [Pseudoflavonifractor sp.]
MRYKESVLLRNGAECTLRNAEASDAESVLENFNLTHQQTDYLLTYSDENHFDIAQERQFLLDKENSENAVEICAFVDGILAGTAGIEAVGTKDKVKHRADFGISLEKSFWRKGIGRALTAACIACAKQAGYSQLELDVVGTNKSAIELYKSIGFIEFGRNSRGFKTRSGQWQELILMFLPLA